MGITLGFSDSHIPYHDKKAWALLWKIAAGIMPSRIAILGDFLDLSNISKYGKDIDLAETFQQEIEAGLNELMFIRELFPLAEILFLGGNHDCRLEKYIMRKCPEFRGMIKIEKLLCLDALKIKWQDFGPNQGLKIGDYLLRHRVGGSIATASQRAGCNVVYGDSHRMGFGYHTTLDGRIVRCINCGWLGDRSSPAYDYIQTWKMWQLGFFLIHEDKEKSSIELIEIHKDENSYWAFVMGKKHEIPNR